MTDPCSTSPTELFSPPPRHCARYNYAPMALASGTKLGPYEIIAPLGAGGMGEVYRATQSSLGRQVAIKILSPEFAANPDRLRRFELEARSASALNHPNIISIYDVGSEGGNSYIAMEFVDGKTLRTLLEAGPKSRIFTKPSRVTMTFSGFRSRCTMFAACALDRPSAICAAICNVFLILSGIAETFGLDAELAQSVQSHQPLSLFNRFDPVAGFTANLPAGMRFNKRSRSTSEQLMIISNQKLDDAHFLALLPPRVQAISHTRQLGIIKRTQHDAFTVFPVLLFS